MSTGEAISTIGRTGLSALLITLLISFACAARPSGPAALANTRDSEASAEGGLKKENLTYADRVAWRSRLNWPSDCESTFDYPDKSFAGLSFYELSPSHNLVQVTCNLGTYQGTYVFMLLDESGSPPKSKLLHFTTYEDSGESGSGRLQKVESTQLVGTPEFDQGAKQLRVLNKFRGLGDCGFQASYVFSQGQPELTLLQGKLDCDRKIVSPREWKKILLR
jgi:hypothetical protein